jgi:hypothetical protein
LELSVVEITLREGADVHVVRKWAADSIRGGDALVLEEEKLFFVLADVPPGRAALVAERLRVKGDQLGADLALRLPGSDPIADSIYRRAEAQILPVQPRR